MHPRPGSRVEARKKHRRGNLIAAAAIVLAAGALALVVTAFLVLSQHLSQKDEDIAKLAEQVRALGGTPVAGARGSPGEAGVVGPSGPPGPSGEGHVRAVHRAGDGPVDGVWPSDHAAVVADLVSTRA